MILLRIELPYFRIDSAYGGVQDWFPNFMMREGGCAAVTACDCSIYFQLYRQSKNLYPFDIHGISRQDYVKFADIMKPYLHPRWTGIDRLDIYIDGFTKFLRDRYENRIELLPWDGSKNLFATRILIKNQIDAGYPIPCLVLNHSNPTMRDYYWHWFILNGYEDSQKFLVKAVTYGSWRWINLATLWDSGSDHRGGLIIFNQI